MSRANAMRQVTKIKQLLQKNDLEVKMDEEGNVQFTGNKQS